VNLHVILLLYNFILFLIILWSEQENQFFFHTLHNNFCIFMMRLTSDNNKEISFTGLRLFKVHAFERDVPFCSHHGDKSEKYKSEIT